MNPILLISVWTYLYHILCVSRVEIQPALFIAIRALFTEPACVWLGAALPPVQEQTG